MNDRPSLERIAKYFEFATYLGEGGPVPTSSRCRTTRGGGRVANVRAGGARVRF